MADKITETKNISCGYSWTDTEGKERIAYIQLPNPKANLDGDQAASIFATLNISAGTISNIVITKAELPTSPTLPDYKFNKISDIYKETKKSVEYDIGIE